MEQRERMCIACKSKSDKRFLKRVVRNKSGEIFLDYSGKSDGRGAYICSVKCMTICKKSKLLNKAFKCAVSEEIYDRILKEFEEN